MPRSARQRHPRRHRYVVEAWTSVGFRNSKYVVLAETGSRKRAEEIRLAMKHPETARIRKVR